MPCAGNNIFPIDHVMEEFNQLVLQQAGVIPLPTKDKTEGSSSDNENNPSETCADADLSSDKDKEERDKWILRIIVYHLFQWIVYQCFSSKFTSISESTILFQCILYHYWKEALR